jgi:hypothetical protein
MNSVRLDFGTYTPTLTNVANLDGSTAFECQWMRVGDVVTVSGFLQQDPTLTATSTSLGISLPVPSNFSGASQCGGTAVCNTVAGQCAAIFADTTNDRATFQYLSGDTSNRTMVFSFTYLVIE